MMRNTPHKRPQHRRNPNQRRPQHSKNYQGVGFNQNQNHSQIDLNALDAEQRLDYRPARNRTVLQQNVDKFLNQAREAISSGDRTLSENYLQHADHFTRVLNEKENFRREKLSESKSDKDISIVENNDNLNEDIKKDSVDASDDQTNISKSAKSQTEAI